MRLGATSTGGEARQAGHWIAPLRSATVWVRSVDGSACPCSASRESVFLVIGDIFAHEPAQVAFIQRNHGSRISRRALPTQRSAIPFCHGACTLGLQPHTLQE